MSRSRLSRTLSTVMVAALVLAGCNGRDSGGSATVRPGSPEQSKITVGTLPIVDSAPLYIAQQRGYFAQEGLEVDIRTLSGGAAAIPSLADGRLQFAIGNYVSFFTAQANRTLDIKFVADGYQAKRGTFLIMVGKNSRITQPRNLAGKRIAVNSKANIVELTARSSLDAAGVDPRTVTFAEVGFGDMPAALERGDVDAALMNEPYITQSERQSGTIAMLDAAAGPTEDMPVAAWATSGKFAKENPRTAAAFQRAIVKGQSDASDRGVVEGIVTNYVKVDPQTAVLMNLGSWPTTMSTARMQRVIDLMKKYGQFTATVSPDTMIFTPPAG
jgi:NitT/TauT family transport system substrate-binding protein